MTVADDQKIEVKRLVDAPRDLVFDTFTQREHVVNWWVPEGTEIHEWDPQPGGLWRYSMPGPDGNLMPFRIAFIEIDKPTRLVYDFSPDMEGAPEPVRTIVDFTEEAGKTRITLTLTYASAAAREQAMQYGAAAGAQQALGSLADYLATL
ncbi:MAG TPA: SRPBCC domain-containing protein [Pseudodesulfovibrio sp.]|nr:SRPBCC domain-containing protein [Pseudodesulfovibrio sp.]